MFNQIVILIFLFSSFVFGNLPPTSTQISGDTAPVTTFKIVAPTFTGTHSGTTLNLSLPLDGLSNVAVSSPALNNILTWNGSQWVNAPATSVSAGSGVDFYNATPITTGTSAINSNQIATLTAAPITTTEQTVVRAISTNTVIMSAWSFVTALGRSTLDAGTWTFNQYCGVSSTAGGRVTTVTRNIYQVVPSSDNSTTITTTGSGTTRTATASGGTPFVSGDASATNTVSGYVQTPNGLYPITAFTSSTVVTITVPTGYTNESAVTFSTWKNLFGATSSAYTSISPSYSLNTFSTTQASYVIASTDTIGAITFGTSNNTTTLTCTYNGTTHNSYFSSPLVILHNNLVGLQGGQSNQYYHLTSSEYTGTGTGNFVRASSPTITTPTFSGTASGNISGTSSNVTGVITAANGGSGQTSLLNSFTAYYDSVVTTLGDLVYSGTSAVPTRLAGDTSNTRKFLREQSSAGVATAPAWDTLQSGDIPNNSANTTGTATNATNVNTTATNSSASTFYPSFVGSASGGLQGIDTSTGLTYVPFTNALSVGKIGLGTTTTPVNDLSINASTAILTSAVQVGHSSGNFGLVVKRTANDAGPSNITFLKSRGDAATPAQSGDSIGNLRFSAIDGTSASQDVAALIVNNNTVSGTNIDSYMTFSTKPTASALAERMRIDNAGNVGIGTTLPGKLLDVAGAGSFSGQITSTVSTGTAPFVISSTTQVPNLYVARSALSDTATALAATPTACSANNYATSIAASGNLTCSTVSDSGLANSYLYANGTRALTGDWSAGSSRTITAGTFSGQVSGNVTGTASGNTTYTANNHGIVVSGSGNTMTVIAPDASATKVLKSGGSSADPSWLAYDNANTASTLVFRDSSNNFSAGTITASLTGHSSLDLALTGGTMSGVLAMGTNNITSTGTISATTFSGALSGNATTATTSTNIAGGANGSLPYQTASGATSLLAAGTVGQTLIVSTGTIPSWSTQWVTSGTNLYFNTGNVGVGGTPSNPLDVLGNVNAATIQRIYNSNAGASASSNLILGNDNDSGKFYIQQNSSANGAFIGANGTVFVNKSAGMTFATNNTTAFSLDTSQNATLQGYLIAGANILYMGKGSSLVTGGGASDAGFLVTGSNNFLFATSGGAGNNERMRITNAGTVGIGTTSPNSTLHLAGPIATAVVASSGTSYIIGSGDSKVLLSGTTGTITATLPTAVGVTGREYTIKRTGTGATSYIVNTTSSQTIDGSTTYTLSAQYKYITVASDGANWVIIANN